LAILRYFLFLPQNSLVIYSPSHSHRTPFSSSGRLCCTISEFTYFINFYWMREYDITVNLWNQSFSILSQSKHDLYTSQLHDPKLLLHLI
jgi:hypothetical protein